MVDFRRTSPPNTAPTCCIQHLCSCSYWLLGPTISQDPKWASSTDTIIKKAQSRILLILFYSEFILSVLCTSSTVCFGSAIPQQNENRLGMQERECSKNYWYQAALHSGLIQVQKDCQPALHSGHIQAQNYCQPALHSGLMHVENCPPFRTYTCPELPSIQDLDRSSISVSLLSIVRKRPTS